TRQSLSVMYFVRSGTIVLWSSSGSTGWSDHRTLGQTCRSPNPLAALRRTQGSLLMNASQKVAELEGPILTKAKVAYSDVLEWSKSLLRTGIAGLAAGPSTWNPSRAF